MKLEAKKYLFDMMKPQRRLQPENPKRWSSRRRPERAAKQAGRCARYTK